MAAWARGHLPSLENIKAIDSLHYKIRTEIQNTSIQTQKPELDLRGCFAGEGRVERTGGNEREKRRGKGARGRWRGKGWVDFARIPAGVCAFYDDALYTDSVVRLIHKSSP